LENDNSGLQRVGIAPGKGRTPTSLAAIGMILK